MRITRLAVFTIFFVFLVIKASAGDDSRPNFIVFLTDDQGWGDLGCYGHPLIKSPNLDQFASEGLRLTQCYAACSVCSPSRSAILTGRTPYRNGVWRWIPSGSQYHLRKSEITIAKLLRERGYETCHAGKWHLNGKFNSQEQPQPDDHGYDHWLATQNNAAPHHLNPTNYVRNRKAVGRLEGPSAVLAANEAISWLKKRRDSKSPFFITVWTHEPHLPIESAPEFMKPYESIADEGIRQHHGNITQMDHAFGQLMKAVDEMGYRENTFVIFTSDNGPEGQGTKGRTRGSTGGLRGRKRHTHEGGIRVPGIVRWPGRIKPGSVSKTPVIGSDIFATVCDIVDIPLPEDRTIDGASMLPVFDNLPIQRVQPLYWRNHLAPREYRVGLRVGDWKIVGSDDLSSFELYNLANDPTESKNLAQTEPQRFQMLKQKLVTHDAAVLREGPDWWKEEAQKARGRKGKGKSTEPPAGKDNTGKFESVLGTTVTTSDLGMQMQSKSEALAFQKLEKPIAGKATIRLSYRCSGDGKTKNGALVIAEQPTNSGSFKIGTAIGLKQHVAFSGGWSNLGSAGIKNADFNPGGLFLLEVRVDLKARKATASINGDAFEFSLPKNMKTIQYLGIYNKDTITEFTLPIVVSTDR